MLRFNFFSSFMSQQYPVNYFFIIFKFHYLFYTSYTIFYHVLINSIILLLFFITTESYECDIAADCPPHMYLYKATCVSRLCIYGLRWHWGWNQCWTLLSCFSLHNETIIINIALRNDIYQLLYLKIWKKKKSINWIENVGGGTQLSHYNLPIRFREDWVESGWWCLNTFTLIITHFKFESNFLYHTLMLVFVLTKFEMCYFDFYIIWFAS